MGRSGAVRGVAYAGLTAGNGDQQNWEDPNMTPARSDLNGTDSAGSRTRIPEAKRRGPWIGRALRIGLVVSQYATVSFSNFEVVDRVFGGRSSVDYCAPVGDRNETR